jgi:hypothetical protein
MKTMKGLVPISSHTIVPVILIFVLSLLAPAASAFECAGVTLPSTIVICSDPELMRLADERQAAINEARVRIGEDRWPELWETKRRGSDLTLQPAASRQTARRKFPFLFRSKSVSCKPQRLAPRLSARTVEQKAPRPLRQEQLSIRYQQRSR